jgi:hypothetical protein
MDPIVTFRPSKGLESLGGLEKAAASPAETPMADPEALVEFSRALQLIDRAQVRPGIMSTVEDPVVALLQTYVAEQTDEKKLTAAPAGALEAQFDEHDLIGWAGSFFTWWRRIKPHAWLTAEPGPDSLENTFRLTLFGDWGTGLYGAPVCAKSIANASDRADLILHLGDTYYSGTEKEVKNRMLAPWPVVPGARNRTCNGNHEMYTGGHGYFKHALTKFDQAASYFAYQNDHWLLAGLDTAYSDHDLHGDQVAWLEDLVSKAGERKLILFSHHQPFSLLESQGPKLVKKLTKLLASRRIYAWYWGHEHHCVLYKPHPLWGLRGRCVGHGGFPYFREKQFGDPPDHPTWRRLDSKNLVPGALVLDGRNPYIEKHEDEYGPHGYMTIEFDGPQAFEQIHDADGTVLRDKPLEENP